MAFSLKLLERLGDQLRDLRLCQVAGTRTGIQVLFYSFRGQFGESLLFGGAGFPALLTGCSEDALSLQFDGFNNGLGQGASKPESDEISSSITFPVGQVSTAADSDFASFRHSASVPAGLKCRRDGGATRIRAHPSCHFRLGRLEPLNSSRLLWSLPEDLLVLVEQNHGGGRSLVGFSGGRGFKIGPADCGYEPFLVQKFQARRS